MAEELTPIDAAARIAHRQLLAALGLIVLLGLAALLGFGSADMARAGSKLWTVLPVIIMIAVASMQRMARRVDAHALHAVRKDELRQASLSRAWRNGFFAVLGLQPLLALAITWGAAANGIALMAAGTVTIGAATVLASMLWYDR
jgi:small-conductance mechanosensitive channel